MDNARRVDILADVVQNLMDCSDSLRSLPMSIRNIHPLIDRVCCLHNCDITLLTLVRDSFIDPPSNA